MLLIKSWTRCAAAVLGLLVASWTAAAAGDVPVADSVMRTDERIASADDLSLFVRQYGVGETPIILLTGGPGYSGDYLEEMALRLGKHHRVILPDQRGTGRSAINPWDASLVTIEASVADVEAMRAHIDAEQIILIGHSWGGVLAMAYASNHGRHVRALVLIGSGGAASNWNMRYTQNILARLNQDDMAALFQAQKLMATDPEAATVDMIRATAPAMIMDRELAFRAADQYAGPAMLTPAVTLTMQRWLQGYDLGDGLSKVDAPVLIVQGEHDPIGEETARETADIFSHSELHFIDNAAHEPYMEQPTAFYKIVEPFLLDHAGSQR